MRVEVGYSEIPDSIAAGKQAASEACLKASEAEPCDLVLLFCTARHDQQLLRDGVVSVVGETPLIYGGGAVGVITNENFGYAGDQVGVACFWLKNSSCTVLVESGLDQGERETGLRLGNRLLEAGVTPSTAMLLFYDAINRVNGNIELIMATWLLEGLKQGLGFSPLLNGAGIQGDHACSVTNQYIGKAMDEHNVISLAFSDDIRMDSVIMHGCRPASPYYTVTKAKGSAILEINGKPALQFMDELLDSSIAPEDYPFFLLFGINHGERWDEYDEDNYASRLCLGIDKEQGAIIMFEPDMTEGTEFRLMFRSLELDYMKPKIESVFSELNGREPLFAVYIDCAGRCTGYGGIDIEDAYVVQEVVGDQVPLLGIYTGVEISAIGEELYGLDWTGVFCLFSKEKEGKAESFRKPNEAHWKKNASGSDESQDIPLQSALKLCEQNAAKILELDTKSIAIRYELEQKRRGFKLLAELAVSLRQGAEDGDIFVTVTQRINAALNMQKTAVLFQNKGGEFVPHVLQGFLPEEKEALADQPIHVDEELLDPEKTILVTGTDSLKRFAGLRESLKLPYFVSAPIMIENEVVAILITGRTEETPPFLSPLGHNDIETVRAVGSLLSSVWVYQRLGDATKRAQIDGLTGLLNRSAFDQRATEALQRSLSNQHEFLLTIIDCDYFKQVNDTYGHIAGDTVLNKLADSLRKNFRYDDIVSRLGGDEFAVCCPLTSDRESTINEIAQLVEEWSSTPIEISMHTSVHSTLSVGIAIAPRDGVSYNELFHSADIALYKAKGQGRNQYAIYDAKDIGHILSE